MQTNKLSSSKVAQLGIQKPEPASKHHHPRITLFRSSEWSTLSGKTSHYHELHKQDRRSCPERALINGARGFTKKPSPSIAASQKEDAQIWDPAPTAINQNSSILSDQSTSFEVNTLHVMTPHETNADSWQVRCSYKINKKRLTVPTAPKKFNSL